jgi:hypothetical protein
MRRQSALEHTTVMADQIAAKRSLQELIKREDLKNKTCIDCNNPNPQWASLRFDRKVALHAGVFPITSQLCSISVLTVRRYT